MAKFKTSARALDLLGRQQIAGIPTAINELFKNAHDAYADNVDVDYFRKEKLLVLRDNGIGMTRNDFESRWLTLGTDSKFHGGKTSMPPIDPSKSLRPVMGEKGIGRLAIASIGKQLLILTRAKATKESDSKTVAAFINWNVFELPGLDLDDIVIPIQEFNALPSTRDVDQMKKELVSSLEELADNGKASPIEIKKLIATIGDFKVSPRELSEKLLGDFDLRDDSYGTHFYISPTDESLNSDIDGEKDKSTSTKIEKMLLGFTNTMTPNHPQPNIIPAFRDHSSLGGTYVDLFNKDSFFTPEDFSLADHHFSGAFDEYGQFSGTINVYQTSEFEHKIPWSGNHFKKTDCGSFTINVAYLQGRLQQSIIEREEHTRLLAKSDNHG